MRHLNALLIKFLMTSVLLFFILTLGYGVSFGITMTISIIITLFAYALGDIVILPKSNNLYATLLDFGFSFVVIWLVLFLFIPQTFPYIGAAIVSAAAIAIGEWFFHKYMGMFVFIGELEDTAVAPQTPNVSTEFSEEFDHREEFKETTNNEKE
ncbi:DUF2512 family protein [Anaerobacillus sp. MEB173]|uniref:DUF2512 family protein n=1 Tax=Anaerobacillus sp. MEB173 TaxID=3383345 RepID=UPI003F8FE770